jgi:hypothetical protein
LLASNFNNITTKNEVDLEDNNDVSKASTDMSTFGFGGDSYNDFVQHVDGVFEEAVKACYGRFVSLSEPSIGSTRCCCQYLRIEGPCVFAAGIENSSVRGVGLSELPDMVELLLLLQSTNNHKQVTLQAMLVNPSRAFRRLAFHSSPSISVENKFRDMATLEDRQNLLLKGGNWISSIHHIQVHMTMAHLERAGPENVVNPIKGQACHCFNSVNNGGSASGRHEQDWYLRSSPAFANS